MQTWLEYDDILLVPQHSDLRSSSEADLSVKYGEETYLMPLIAAPMDSFYHDAKSGLEFISALDKQGILGFVHRFMSKDERLVLMKMLYDKDIRFGVSVGLQDSFDEEFIASIALARGAAVICVDVANGHNWFTLQSTEGLANLIATDGFKTQVMAGNVASHEGYVRLLDSGAHMIRVGIGSGRACTTRNMTGVGTPMVTLLQELDYNYRGGIIIADGGIKYPGDIMKALATGAHGVMTGYLLSGTKETTNGTYRGLASRSAQEDHFGFVRSVEGIEIPAKHSNRRLEDVLKEIADNLRRGFSYLGVRNMKELREEMWEYVQVTPRAIKDLDNQT